MDLRGTGPFGIPFYAGGGGPNPNRPGYGRGRRYPGPVGPPVRRTPVGGVGTALAVKGTPASAQKAWTHAIVGGLLATAQVASSINEIVHHCRILVDDVGEDVEAVIIDDGVDLPSKRRKHGFYYPANLFDVVVRANHVPFEINKKSTFLRMIGKAALQWDTNQVVAQPHCSI